MVTNFETGYILINAGVEQSFFVMPKAGIAGFIQQKVQVTLNPRNFEK